MAPKNLILLFFGQEYFRSNFDLHWPIIIYTNTLQTTPTQTIFVCQKGTSFQILPPLTKFWKVWRYLIRLFCPSSKVNTISLTLPRHFLLTFLSVSDPSLTSSLRDLLQTPPPYPPLYHSSYPSARRGFPLFSCFNIEPCNDIYNYLII